MPTLACAMKNKLKVMFKCKYCSVIFSTAEKLIEHKRNEHGSILVPRTVTSSSRDDAEMATNSLTAESSQAASDHGQEQAPHTTIRTTQKATKPNLHIFKCRICDQCFDKKEDLDCHLEFHAQETHSCRCCDKEFLKRSDLLMHEEHCPSGSRKSTDTVRQNNDTAKENGSSTSSRETPICAKLQEVAYECRFCKKNFGSVKALKLHLRLHSGEMTYSCKFCNVKFSQASNMERHKKMCADNVPRRNSEPLAQPSTMKIGPFQRKRINSIKMDPDRRHEAVFQVKSQRVRPKSRSLSNTSTTDRLHNCDYCGSNFSHSAHVEQHQKICFARFDASQGSPTFRPEFSRSLHETTSRNTALSPPTTFYRRQPGQDKPDWEELRTQTISNKTARTSSCKFCDKEFQCERDVKIHERIHAGEKPNSSNARYRKSHTSSFKSPNKFHLKPEGFDKERELVGEQKHKDNAKQEIRNRKESANMSNQSKASSNIHINATMLDGKLIYTCSHCGKTFASLKLCRLHILAHDLRPYKCGQCHASFSNPVAVRHHMSQCKIPLPLEFETESVKNSEQSSGENTLPVSHPARLLPVEKELEDQGNKKEDKRCDETYTPQLYVPHVNQVHRNGQFFGYSCEICKKVLIQAFSMRKHMRAHIGSNIYKCPQCEQTFEGFLDVYRHQKFHTDVEDGNSRNSRKPGRPSASCPDFDVNFTEKIIEGTRWFKCNFCARKSLYRSHIRNHITVHTGTYPHYCSICNDGFSSARGLVEHMKKHNRGQQCSKCPLQFTTVDDLRKHLAGHVGIKPLLCMKCGEWFQFAEDLHHHMSHEH